MNSLEKRCIELSYRHKLTHVSSVLNTVNLLDEIYAKRGPDDPVVLGNSHAALALYVVLEKNGLCDAEEMIHKHGVHAGRDMHHGIWVSGGSLGQAETVAVGLALACQTIAHPARTVWLITSDGACMEGAVYEVMRAAAKFCPNLKIYIVFNGFGAYGEILVDDLPRLHPNTIIEQVDTARYPEWLRGLNGHYLTLTEAQYEELMV